MQDILVAVSKAGLSPAEVVGLRALKGREYEHIKQFYFDVDLVMRAPGANVNITFGNTEDWARFLESEAFDAGAHIYITVKAAALI